jgi:tetratricopeptide (TPR) repeat protein
MQAMALANKRRRVAPQPAAAFVDADAAADEGASSAELARAETEGDRLAAEGRFEAALARWRDVLAVRPSAKLHEQSAQVGGRARRGRCGARCVDSRRPCASLMREYLRARAQLLLEVGEPFKAIQSAAAAATLDPTWSVACLTLARSQLNFGEYEMALVTLEKG